MNRKDPDSIPPLKFVSPFDIIRNRMQDHLTINPKNALKAYSDGSADNKVFLKTLFPDLDFDQTLPITDRVKSYEDACRIEGATPLSIDDFGFLPEEDQECAFAEHQYTVIRRVLNEGWKWMPGETGYYPVFNRPQSAGGPGFSFYDSACDRSGSSVGARRMLKSPELAIYMGKQFLSINQIIHNEQ